MRKQLGKKSVQAVLVIALLVIWSYNTYSIVGIGNKNEEAQSFSEKTNIKIGELEVPEISHQAYKANFRDPFKPILKKKVRSKPKARSQQPVKKVKIPALKLTGIVEQMALIQNQNQQLFFVSQGDDVEGAQVQFVSRDSVGLVFKSKKFTLKLNN